MKKAKLEQVLLIGSDDHQDELLRTYLTTFMIRNARDFGEALTTMRSLQPSIVLLDAEVIEHKTSHIQLACSYLTSPLFVLSNCPDAEMKARCLDAGADDYLVKPVRLLELSVRMRAAIARTRKRDLSSFGEAIQVGGLKIEPLKRSVFYDSEAIKLQPTEYRVLLALARDAGSVIDHSRLRNEVYGIAASKKRTGIRVHIFRLRQKLSDAGADPTMIKTVCGMGYRLKS